MEDFYDPIRQKFVRATEEEKIRQQLLRKMIDELSYPKGLIAVEQELPALNRRIDILCYALVSHELKPLLLIECKRGKWNLAAEKQLLGYNFSVGAPFIALAGASQIKTFWREQGKIVSAPFLPKYPELLYESRFFMCTRNEIH